MKNRYFLLAALTIAVACLGWQAAETEKPPFEYVWGTAYHVLPSTHNNESGYFSLCEGRDGRIYVGTAKYDVNSFLVEFDPRTERQRIVVDTHKLCGLTATGYAAQAKIHTRNSVGPSGKIYFGSMQGHRRDDHTETYPGGYVMTYDPRTGEAENLGMPCPGLGVIDVVADERRGLIYAISIPEGRWMLYDMRARTHRELGPRLTAFAATLIDGKGRANAITERFELAQYDPDADRVTVRTIRLADAELTDPNVPCWNLSPDGRTAYLVQLDDPTLIAIDLYSARDQVQARSHGRMIEGQGYDSRGAVSVAPDGRVYVVFRVTNETGFGEGYVHHLLRFDPKAGKTQDLGVLAVRNPEFFDFGPDKDGNAKPFSYGFHRLPDGTLTPLHVHLAMTVTADNTVYVTILYPFTLLRIDQFREARREAPSPAERYIDFALGACDRVEKDLPRITKVAELMAKRHLAGGMIGFIQNNHPLVPELYGRSGGIMHIGFDRCWKPERSKQETVNDMALVGLTASGHGASLEKMKQEKARGCMLIGFGPRRAPGLTDEVGLCNAFFDNGFAADDRVVQLPGGARTGRGADLVDVLYAWTLVAEHVGALTREGRMPIMAKAWLYEDGRAWWDHYFQKGNAFHDDVEVAPSAPGELGRLFLDRIRSNLLRFRRWEIGHVQESADVVVGELKRGNKTIIAGTGHMTSLYIGRDEEGVWTGGYWDMWSYAEELFQRFRQTVPEGALTLRLGYAGLHRNLSTLFLEKKQRVILLTGENTREEWQLPEEFTRSLAALVDLGYAMGDACVRIEGYPIRIIPPSGIMQLVAYQAINAEVLTRRR
ncbi:MAG: hypothetical protein JXE06_08550 [Coriobacteriia bacterium]|nr:hypothetical protein [Coriobacteriia bacterium]